MSAKTLHQSFVEIIWKRKPQILPALDSAHDRFIHLKIVWVVAARGWRRDKLGCCSAGVKFQSHEL